MGFADGFVTLQGSQRPGGAYQGQVTAQAVSDPNALRDLLVEQVTASVRWRESVLYMKQQGVTNLLECGAGAVLSGMTKRIDKEIAAQSLSTPEDIDAFLKTVG